MSADEKSKTINDELFELCEKLYFHEVDTRDKVNARLQMPFAIGVAMAGILSFMLQNLDRAASGTWLYVFYGCYFFSGSFIFLGTWYFIKAAWSTEYQFVAPGVFWTNYKAECYYSYEHLENADELARNAFRSMLSDQYGRTSSANAIANDMRAYHLHLTLKFLIHAGMYAMFALMVFYFSGLNKQEKDSPVRVLITAPITLEK
ncbi:hypothetical protein [Herbaspirillum aquaticum]|jgi:hypothetical protein|uniref:Uncharacterized protein n=1 Tax=Herbaspirillum aquaticum TaxID=568783 RepID=A0A225T1J3_9BURK|nr:hypothetical protein [Herbaspirillum aquaticum]OWY35932.1 hypothetical protein CEJ45_05910 [Herbaspirillum aquaticum]